MSLSSVSEAFIYVDGFHVLGCKMRCKTFILGRLV